jgi:hypothetical protein
VCRPADRDLPCGPPAIQFISGAYFSGRPVSTRERAAGTFEMAGALLAPRQERGIRKRGRFSRGGFCKEVFCKDMTTVRKGNGTTSRRRTKSAAKEAAATTQESNGASPHKAASEAGSKTETNIETIRVRAFELYLARGAAHGDDLADWINAERELHSARRP